MASYLKTNLSSQEKHNYILENYVFHRNKSCVRDEDVIKEHHKFLWNDDTGTPTSWQEKMAKAYYEKLFKEYAIADLSRYKENKIALRWRSKPEVITGIGQFICGSLKCSHNQHLKTWEVNFGYIEQGVKKNALVKLRLCPVHSEHLNFTSKKREIKRLKKSGSEKASSKAKRKELERLERASEKKKSNKAIEKESAEEQEETVSEEYNGSAETDVESTEKFNYNIQPVTKTREAEFEEYLDDLLL